MQVYLDTLGCRLNEAETQRWARDFYERGHRIGTEATGADVIVVNTCAVTEEAERKSRQHIRRMRRLNPHAQIVATGCYATLRSDRARDYGADRVFGNADKRKLPETLSAEFAVPRPGETLPPPSRFASRPAQALHARKRSRAFVQIQDGCRHRCTYCVVTLARGEERSRGIGEIVAEIRTLVAEEIQEVVLTGVHVGGYGSDLGANLAELVAAILADTDLPRLRLGSVEPWDLPRALLSAYANPRMMPHLHLPLQSGCDAVLKRMGRQCRTRAYAALVEALREQTPDFNVTTDVIVGFPGETENEWRTSLRFIERMGFPHVHAFGYSPRPGTAAARMSGQVPEDARQGRQRELQELASKMKRAFLQRHAGHIRPVLWEGYRKAADLRGYTPNFLRVQAAPGYRPPAYAIRPALLQTSTPAESLLALPPPLEI